MIELSLCMLKNLTQIFCLLALPNNLSLQWDIIRNVTSTTEQIIFLCDKTPRRRPATIKIYKNNSQYKFHQESTVLHSLKGQFTSSSLPFLSLSL